jgi:hypothetical protein
LLGTESLLAVSPHLLFLSLLLDADRFDDGLVASHGRYRNLSATRNQSFEFFFWERREFARLLGKVLINANLSESDTRGI